MDRSDCLVHLNKDNLPTTSSLTVAEAFGKEHRNVVRAIRDLIATAGEAPLDTVTGSGEGLLNFEQSFYKANRGRTPFAYLRCHQ